MSQDDYEGHDLVSQHFFQNFLFLNQVWENPQNSERTHHSWMMPLPIFLKHQLDPTPQNYQMKFQQTVTSANYQALSPHSEDVMTSELFDLMPMLPKLMMAWNLNPMQWN
jgi:hypothetical protein